MGIPLDPSCTGVSKGLVLIKDQNIKHEFEQQKQIVSVETREFGLWAIRGSLLRPGLHARIEETRKGIKREERVAKQEDQEE